MNLQQSHLHSRRSIVRAASAVLETLENRRLFAESVWAYPAADGQMIYKPRDRGDHIMDFGNVGYMGGTVPLPDIPVKVTISPVAGDDEANIEGAIAAVAA